MLYTLCFTLYTLWFMISALHITTNIYYGVKENNIIHYQYIGESSIHTSTGWTTWSVLRRAGGSAGTRQISYQVLCRIIEWNNIKEISRRPREILQVWYNKLPKNPMTRQVTQEVRIVQALDRRTHTDNWGIERAGVSLNRKTEVFAPRNRIQTPPD